MLRSAPTLQRGLANKVCLLVSCDGVLLLGKTENNACHSLNLPEEILVRCRVLPFLHNLTDASQQVHHQVHALIYTAKQGLQMESQTGHFADCSSVVHAMQVVTPGNGGRALGACLQGLTCCRATASVRQACMQAGTTAGRLR